MNTRPGVTIGVCAAVVVLALIYIFARSSGAMNRPHVVNLGNYYTADEGQTSIVDTWTQIPPFQRNGMTYVRMYMFEDGKTKKVGYLEKFSDDALAYIGNEQDPHELTMKLNQAMENGLLVKKPGDANWVPRQSPEGLAIIRVMTSDGRGQAKPALPEMP